MVVVIVVGSDSSSRDSGISRSGSSNSSQEAIGVRAGDLESTCQGSRSVFAAS